MFQRVDNSGPSAHMGAVSRTASQAQAPNQLSQNFSFPKDDKSYQAFLCQNFLHPLDYQRIAHYAETHQLTIEEILIKHGWVRNETYYRALAQFTSMPFVGIDTCTQLHPKAPSLFDPSTDAPSQVELINWQYGVAMLPKGMSPQEIMDLDQQVRQSGLQLAITCDGAIRQAQLNSHENQLVHHAQYGLEARFAHESARTGLNVWQMIGLISLVGLTILGSFFEPSLTLLSLSFFLSLFFFFITSLRLSASRHSLDRNHLVMRQKKQRRRKPVPDNQLPVYTILVPLYNEANILPTLIKALHDLDYPKVKLDIKLILEEVDKETQATLFELNLPEYFDIIIVPDSQPRTKSKAVNFALQFARGHYVVIYDAEDIPEPDQLRKAVSQFAISPMSLGCLQAKLNFYNTHENWFTKQFTIEYTALFDGLLPCYAIIDFPIPLGGTSNHFRIEALRAVGAWDAFNVTEDADLGMRLYRHGYSSEMLDSTTYEEANCKWHNWLTQRTRWLKGWMQTYIVHNRQPLTLLRDLGPWRFFGFHAIMGGLIFSSLINPIYIAIALLFHPLATFGGGSLEASIWALSLFNLIAGYGAAMALGFITVKQRGIKNLSWQLLLVPVYWLLISLAAYRALFQLCYAPHYWEKTTHGLSKINPHMATFENNGVQKSISSLS